VDFLKFEGTTVELGEAFNLVKRQELTAPLPRLIRRTWELVGTFVRTRRRLRGLEMIEQPEYPDFAWREVMVNAIAHRDYSITGTAIQVRMFGVYFNLGGNGLKPQARHGFLSRIHGFLPVEWP